MLAQEVSAHGAPVLLLHMVMSCVHLQFGMAMVVMDNGCSLGCCRARQNSDVTEAYDFCFMHVAAKRSLPAAVDGYAGAHCRIVASTKLTKLPGVVRLQGK
jgi:hypothetical protein